MTEDPSITTLPQIEKKNGLRLQRKVAQTSKFFAFLHWWQLLGHKGMESDGELAIFLLDCLVKS